MSAAKNRIPPLFVNQFSVDYEAPFRRHLNRLEVEVGKEDYRHLKRVELLATTPDDDFFFGMIDITERVMATTQNLYNLELLSQLRVRVLLDAATYRVYYRMPDRTICFRPWWREKVLQRFFGELPVADSGWRAARSALPGFEVRFVPDEEGGALLLRRLQGIGGLPLLTATHGPYDPHTLEVTLYFLRTGKGGSALVNLGFAGREPLTDENLERLKDWGVPLNPSNIDVIYPYLDHHGDPCCYKMERQLRRYVELLEIAPPELIIDIHGCVGTESEDRQVVVGLGGLPPYHQPQQLGNFEVLGKVLHLFPTRQMRHGLSLIRELSDRIFLQFCTDEGGCYHFALLGQLQLIGRKIDPASDVDSLLPGEERTYLPTEKVRWLPGAGANALQRLEASRLPGPPLCLHVEIPTAVRRRMVVKLKELEITDSLDSSGL